MGGWVRDGLLGEVGMEGRFWVDIETVWVVLKS